MKRKSFLLVLSILLLGFVLSSCTGATSTNSWGGVTADDSTVYFTNTTSIDAVKADAGTLVWSYPDKPAATRLFFAAPVITGDQLIVGDYSGLLVGLGVRDGKELWQFTGAKGRYVDSPLVVNDKIIAQNADGNIYALDMKGNLIWKFKGKNAFWATPASDGTILYAPSMDHFIYAVNLSDGQLKWKEDLGASVVGSPLLASDGTLYVGNLDSTLFALNSSDGTIKWQRKLSGGIWSAPVTLDDRLYLGDQSGNIYILKSADGSIVQTINLESAVLDSGALMGNDIVFGDEKGEITVIGKNGERLWMRSLNGKIYSNMIFSNNHIYVMPTKGDKPIYAYDTNGNEIWNYSPSK